MTRKLVRFSYDQQILDLEWRKTYVKLLETEAKKSTLPTTGDDATYRILLFSDD
jgi:hypothetical protein